MQPFTDDFRVILNQQDLLQVAPKLMLDSGLAAVGRVREHDTLEGREFILDRWEIVSPFPNGRQRPPMTTWAVMLSEDSTSLDSLIERLSPKRSQRVIVLLLNRKDHSKLTLAAWFDGRWTNPSEVSLVGSGMLTLKSSDRFTAVEESSDQSIRASRTRDALPRGVFEKVRSAQVAMVGAGGGGIALAGCLVSIGILKLTMIDSDRLGPENLDRMPWVRHQSVGEHKTKELACRLAENQPDLLVRGLPYSIQSDIPAEHLRSNRPDVMFSFVDSNSARLATSLLARELETIHIDLGSSVVWEEKTRVLSGDIRLFEPGQGRGCVACVPAMPQIEDVLYDLSRPPGSLARGPQVPWNESRAGSLFHLNHMVAALAMELWVAWLSGSLRTSTWTRLRWRGEIPEVRQTSVASPAGSAGEKSCRFCWE
jgi:molybdopterin/thiamine biosynthesis adenylyltransferase